MNEIINAIVAALARARTDDGATFSVSVSGNVIRAVTSDRDNRTTTFTVTVAASR